MISKLFGQNRIVDHGPYDWVTLYFVFGSCEGDPTKRDLKLALKELFNKADDEHFTTWIECGVEDGQLHTLEIYDSGFAIYTRHSDGDMTEQLESLRVDNVDKKIALTLWMKLISGNWKT